MKKRDLYKEILTWAHKRQGSGFLEEQELFKDLNLNKEQINWYLKVFRSNIPISENLIAHFNYDDAKNKHYFTLSAKGLAEYSKLEKPWHEKLSGKILFILFTAIIAFLVGKFGDSILVFIKDFFQK